MTGQTPSDVLQMEPMDKQLAMRCATALEEWRWDQRKRLLKGAFGGN